jgi:hypothetical protein
MPAMKLNGIFRYSQFESSLFVQDTGDQQTHNVSLSRRKSRK